MQSSRVFTAKRISTVSTQMPTTKDAQANRPAPSSHKPAQRVPVPVLTQEQFDAKVAEILAARNLERAGSVPSRIPVKSAEAPVPAKRVPVPVLTQEQFNAKVAEILAARNLERDRVDPPKAPVQTKRVPVPVLSQEQFDAKVAEIRASASFEKSDYVRSMHDHFFGVRPARIPAPVVFSRDGKISTVRSARALIRATKISAQRAPVAVLSQEQFDAKVTEIRAARNLERAGPVPSRVAVKSVEAPVPAKRAPVPVLSQEQFNAKVAEILAARNLERAGPAPAQVQAPSSRKPAQRAPVPVLSQEQFDAKVAEIRAAQAKGLYKPVAGSKTFRARRIQVSPAQEQPTTKIVETGTTQVAKELACGVPHVNSCTVSGLGAIGGKAVGSAVAVSIQLKDQGGSTVNAPMSSVSVSVKSPSYQDVAVTLANGGQGHFVAVFTPSIQGNWVVIATVNGALINGSPLFPEFH